MVPMTLETAWKRLRGVARARADGSLKLGRREQQRWGSSVLVVLLLREEHRLDAGPLAFLERQHRSDPSLTAYVRSDDRSLRAQRHRHASRAVCGHVVFLLVGPVGPLHDAAMKLTSLPWRRHRSSTMGLLVIAQLAPPQFDPAPATAPSSISAGPRNHGAESLPCPYTAVPYVFLAPTSG